MPSQTDEISQWLIKRGWSIDPITFSAKKSYSILDRGRQSEAIIYRRGERNVTAEYWSEGQNALSCCHNNLQPLNTESELEQYLSKVESAIDGTYGRRVYRLCNSFWTTADHSTCYYQRRIR
jgi:hypothetical protein